MRIASTFVHTPAEQLDDNVDDALAELGSMGAVDRVEVVLFDAVNHTMSNTHEWVAPGVPALRVAGAIHTRRTARCCDGSGSTARCNIPSVADLGPDWGQEQVWFERRGVRSMLAVPLADQGRVIGMLGFEAVHDDWTYSAGHLLTLRTAAGILGQAFAKRDAEERLAFQARHDPLTGLPNRWAFLEALQRAVHRLHSSLGGRRPERGRAWPCCCSTSTGSRWSTTHSATDSATSCSSRWPGGCARPARRARCWPGWVATSW